jgi:hypothetical protein
MCYSNAAPAAAGLRGALLQLLFPGLAQRARLNPRQSSAGRERLGSLLLLLVVQRAPAACRWRGAGRTKHHVPQLRGDAALGAYGRHLAGCGQARQVLHLVGGQAAGHAAARCLAVPAEHVAAGATWWGAAAGVGHAPGV